MKKSEERPLIAPNTVDERFQKGVREMIINDTKNSINSILESLKHATSEHERRYLQEGLEKEQRWLNHIMKK